MYNKPKKAAPSSSVSTKSSFQVVEAYKAIRINLLFALSTSSEHSVIITGAEPDVGKSTTTANLAVTMAQMGARVLVVDADMRKPMLHKIFRQPNHEGLSHVLGGLQSFEAAVHRDVFSGLDVLSAGPIPPNPSELLGSERMAQFLSQATQQYDFVFLDTPPVNVVADALTFQNMAGGVLLIARQRHTHYDELEKAAEKIKSLGGNVLGVIINDVRESYKSYAAYKNYKYKEYDYEYKKE